MVAFDMTDLDRSVDQSQRDAMLDLVLAWGSLDGALAMLLTRMVGVPFEEGAALVGKMPGSAVFAEMHRALKAAPGGADAARLMKRHKRAYERHSDIRNHIAHSHLAGVQRSDPDRLVFAVYQRCGDGGLVVDAVHIDQVRRATRWGRAMRVYAMRVVDTPLR